MKASLGTRIPTVATAVVVVSIVAGVIMIGSPVEGRLQRLDSGRISDFRGVMSASDLFWSRNERLPESLSKLAEDPRTSNNTVDPGTAEPYEYRAVGDDTYELCATFDRASSEPPGRPTSDFWRHSAGRQCFRLEVDQTKGR